MGTKSDKPTWWQNDLVRSLIYFLAGLPLVVLLLSLADPLLEPFRQSKVLRLVAFSVLMGWIILMSGLGSGFAIRRQLKEIPRSSVLRSGPLSGFLMAINGIVFVLAIISLIIFFIAEL